MKKTVYYNNACDYKEAQWAANVKTQLHLEEYDLVFKFVMKNCDKNAHILDWSALYGHVAHGLSLRGFKRVNAFQFSPSEGSYHSLINLEGIKEKFEYDDPKLIPYIDKSMDVAISCGVLEHVYETGGSVKDSLEEINRILKIGGFFVISHLPNATAVSEIKSDMLGRWGHAFRFTENGVKYLARHHGFEIMLFQRIGILPLAVRIWFKRMKLSLLVRAIDSLTGIYPFKIFCNDFFVVMKKISD